MTAVPLVHTEEVTGSIPVSPTRSDPMSLSVQVSVGAIPVAKWEVRAKLAELHDELNDGVVTHASYTVAQAINDRLADGLVGRAPKTVSIQREVLEPLIG